MFRLSPLDQLQLLATGRSGRSIAKALGVHHKTVQRYLRGERAIPRETAGVLRTVYGLHRDVQREKAQAAGIPWTGIPVAAERTRRTDGSPGQSIKFARPDLLSPQLRERWLRALYQTSKVGRAHIGSRFDVYVYTKTPPERVARGGSPLFKVETESLRTEYRAATKRKKTALGTAHGRQMDIFSSPIAFGTAGDEDRATDQINAALRHHANRATPMPGVKGVELQTIGHTMFFDLAEERKVGKRSNKRIRAKGRR
jgi:transcriptional regulator with XRE-family HTH domain